MVCLFLARRFLSFGLCAEVFGGRVFVVIMRCCVIMIFYGVVRLGYYGIMGLTIRLRFYRIDLSF